VDLTLIPKLVFEHPIGEDFKEHVQKLAKQYKEALHNFGNSYLAALETLRKRSQNKADLKVLLAVKSEIERFNSTRQVTDTVLSDKDTILHLQMSYQKGAERMSVQLWESLQALSDSYIEKLKPIQDDLTKEGKTEKARRIQKEIARINVTPETIVKSESPAKETYNASQDPWDNR